MELPEKLRSADDLFSLEFFPPKKDMPIDSVYEAISQLAAFSPAFVSVTYGAGGASRGRTIEIASHVKNALHMEAIAHLTCVDATPEQIGETLSTLKANGIRNVLALRGDVPEGMDRAQAFR
ncbi:MAG: methylenetetrahydrofolate reductase, partial [Bacillota bacterium]